MKTKAYHFNKNTLTYGNFIEQPTQLEIKSSLGLVNASLDDAVRYGGDVTRVALGAMQLRHDRKYVVVDTKTHMLIPGMSPAIPGWHTDGAPRDEAFNPQGRGLPDQWAQLRSDIRPPRFHLLVTGSGCLTQFVAQPLRLHIPVEPSATLYAIISKATRRRNPSTETVQSCQVVEFDWHDLHTGVVATATEWRYLIRVTETDYLPPCRDLRQVIRVQQNVYSPTDFGW